MNDTFDRVIEILVMRHILAGIFPKIAQAILVTIPVEMCPFTRIPMTRSNASFLLHKIFLRIVTRTILATLGFLLLAVREADAFQHLRAPLKPLGT